MEKYVSKDTITFQNILEDYVDLLIEISDNKMDISDMTRNNEDKKVSVNKDLLNMIAIRCDDRKVSNTLFLQICFIISESYPIETYDPVECIQEQIQCLKSAIKKVQREFLRSSAIMSCKLTRYGSVLDKESSLFKFSHNSLFDRNLFKLFEDYYMDHKIEFISHRQVTEKNNTDFWPKEIKVTIPNEYKEIVKIASNFWTTNGYKMDQYLFHIEINDKNYSLFYTQAFRYRGSDITTPYILLLDANFICVAGYSQQTFGDKNFIGDEIHKKLFIDLELKMISEIIKRVGKTSKK